MTTIEAAYEILKKNCKPMSAKDISDAAISGGLLVLKSKTPEATMGAAIYMDIKRQGAKSRFVKAGTGLFALADDSSATENKRNSLPKTKQNPKTDCSDENSGFVYILKDDHFKHGVKIGKAKNVEKRIRPMLTANPWLSVYVKVQSRKWNEIERTIHNVIKLVAKRKQVKNSEFYVIEPEIAKRILLEFGRLIDKNDFVISDDKEHTQPLSLATRPKRMCTMTSSKQQWNGKTQLAKAIATLGGNVGAYGGILHFFSRKRSCSSTSKWRALLENAGIKFDTTDHVSDWSCANNPL